MLHKVARDSYRWQCPQCSKLNDIGFRYCWEGQSTGKSSECGGSRYNKEFELNDALRDFVEEYNERITNNASCDDAVWLAIENYNNCEWRIELFVKFASLQFQQCGLATPPMDIAALIACYVYHDRSMNHPQRNPYTHEFELLPYRTHPNQFRRFSLPVQTSRKHGISPPPLDDFIDYVLFDNSPVDHMNFKRAEPPFLKLTIPASVGEWALYGRASCVLDIDDDEFVEKDKRYLIDGDTQQQLSSIVLRDVYHYSENETEELTSKCSNIITHHIVGKVEYKLKHQEEDMNVHDGVHPDRVAYLYIVIASGHYKYAWVRRRVLRKRWMDLYDILKLDDKRVLKDCYAFLHGQIPAFIEEEYGEYAKRGEEACREREERVNAETATGKSKRKRRRLGPRRRRRCRNKAPQKRQ